MLFSAHTAAAGCAASATVVVSVVSHGHKLQVQALLNDLAQFSAATVSRVVLTLNQPEADPEAPEYGWPFLLHIVRNSYPLGFGANHNQALSGASEPFVCVLNPDVQWDGHDPLQSMVQVAAQPGVGCSYPAQFDEVGSLQDSERGLPTFAALWRRRLLRRQEARIDWVNAACLVMPQPVWQALGGFDESYFMYCEDVDLCLRIRLAGLALVRAPVQVVHSGQRASHRRWSHLQWHVRSLLRLWRSPVYRQACQMLPAGRPGEGTIGGS